jgi:hypothetical protein
MSKSYFEHNAKLPLLEPRDFVEWKEPPTEPMEVVERDLTEREWLEFKRILRGLE